MDVDDYSDRHVSVKITGAALRRTMLPLLRLKFNFSFKFETSNWILNEDSATLELISGGVSSSEHQTSVTVAVAGDSSLYNDVRAAIREDVDDLLTRDELSELVKAVWENIPAAGTLPMFGVLEFDFTVRVEDDVVIDDDGSGGDGMVAAAEWSLEKCKTDCGSSCCICLDEFGGLGGGGFRLPCSHVFHGGCIREWLRNSHYCPLCRYEMPAAEEEEEDVDEFDEDDDMCIC